MTTVVSDTPRKHSENETNGCMRLEVVPDLPEQEIEQKKAFDSSTEVKNTPRGMNGNQRALLNFRKWDETWKTLVTRNSRYRRKGQSLIEQQSHLTSKQDSFDFSKTEIDSLLSSRFISTRKMNRVSLIENQKFDLTLSQ